MQAKTISRRISARPQAQPARRPPYKLQTGLLLISPWLIGLVLFNLLPILTSLVLSFTRLYLLEPSQVRFIGLQNYLEIFNDPSARQVLLETFRLALIIIPVQTGASVLLAALLSSRKLRMKNTLRVLFFFPSIIPATAAAFMWRGFFNTDSGWANRLLLGPLGLEALGRVFSIYEGSEALVILGSLWTIGPSILIMMGAMQGIHPEIYEAAQIDGAGRLTRFFSMTLPLISPAIFFSLIINLTAVFGGTLLMDRGNVWSPTLSTYDAYVQYNLFSLFRAGYASSLAWAFFVIVMILVLTLFVTSKHWVHFPDREA